jgi:hypothetical protein
VTAPAVYVDLDDHRVRTVLRPEELRSLNLGLATFVRHYRCVVAPVRP